MKAKFKKITIKSIFDKPVVLIAEIIGKKFDGYNTGYGGWSLYKLTPDDTQAEFLIFRKKRKRKLSKINMKEVVSIDEVK